MAGAMSTYVDAPGVYKRCPFYIVQFVLFVLMKQNFLYAGLAIGVLLLFGMVYVFWPKRP